MKLCPKCNTQNPDAAIFCCNCYVNMNSYNGAKENAHQDEDIVNAAKKTTYAAAATTLAKKSAKMAQKAGITAGTQINKGVGFMTDKRSSYIDTVKKVFTGICIAGLVFSLLMIVGGLLKVEMLKKVFLVLFFITCGLTFVTGVVVTVSNFNIKEKITILNLTYLGIFLMCFFASVGSGLWPIIFAYVILTMIYLLLDKTKALPLPASIAISAVITVLLTFIVSFTKMY